jgi:hypothetical protein
VDCVAWYYTCKMDSECPIGDVYIISGGTLSSAFMWDADQFSYMK